ncbi:hypothetical protein VCRA2127O302_600002 [Vibrio crassostreae]|nr:hypothetical protein VCRA2127O302_600002 [Vibrio crassostreae]
MCIYCTYSLILWIKNKLFNLHGHKPPSGLFFVGVLNVADRRSMTTYIYRLIYYAVIILLF